MTVVELATCVSCCIHNQNGDCDKTDMVLNFITAVARLIQSSLLSASVVKCNLNLSRLKAKWLGPLAASQVI